MSHYNRGGALPFFFVKYNGLGNGFLRVDRRIFKNGVCPGVLNLPQNALSFFTRHLQILFLQEIVFVCFYKFTMEQK